jgi:hypothetical protein
MPGQGEQNSEPGKLFDSSYNYLRRIIDRPCFFRFPGNFRLE